MEDTTNTQPYEANQHAISEHDCKRQIKLLTYALTTLIVLAFISVVASVGISISHFDDDLLLSEGDPYIAKAIVPMIQKAKDRQHAVENWCDILMSKDYFTKWRLESTDDPEETKINLVLNEAAAELIAAGKEVPQDMVVMFHGTIGWNQIGGREKLADSYRSNVVHLFLGDYERKFIPIDKIDNLRWNITDTTKPFYNTNLKPFYILNAIVITIGLYIMILRRRYMARYLVLVVIITAASCFVGYFFACGSVSPLYLGEPARIIDYTTVYLISSVVGVCFVLLLAPSVARYKNHQEFFLKTALLGGLCGLAASTLIHIYIMIYRQTTTPLGIIGGAGYGIYAGIILGIITCGMICLAEKLKPQNQPPRPADTPPSKGGEL